MSRRRSFGAQVLLLTLGWLAQDLPAFAQRPALPGDTEQSYSTQGDFDFNIGTWKAHALYLEHPLSGSTAWREIDGTVTVRKALNGHAQIEEFKADSSEGKYETFLLRLYNAQSHQWSFVFANSGGGIVCARMSGGFKNGRGEFFDREPFNGRMILARTLWSDITAKSHRYEVAFSDDGGKTWEPNFLAVRMREK